MKSKPRNKFLFSLIASLVVVIIVISAYIGYLLLSPTADVDVPDYLLDDDGITEIEPALELPDFTLTDQNNNTIRLSDLDSNLTLVTFGFTHCPDVCPITLGEMRNIRDELGDFADSLDYVFISIDGERDTPDVLNSYFRTLRVDNFILGMTGSEAELRTVAAPFGVEFIYNTPDQLGNYTVDHTAGMFLLDTDHNWVRRYRYAIPSDLIADDIRQILQN